MYSDVAGPVSLRMATARIVGGIAGAGCGPVGGTLRRVSSYAQLLCASARLAGDDVIWKRHAEPRRIAHADPLRDKSFLSLTVTYMILLRVVADRIQE